MPRASSCKKSKINCAKGMCAEREHCRKKLSRNHEEEKGRADTVLIYIICGILPRQQFRLVIGRSESQGVMPMQSMRGQSQRWIGGSSPSDKEVSWESVHIGLRNPTTIDKRRPRLWLLSHVLNRTCPAETNVSGHPGGNDIA
jgi:hypothetical protein